MASHTFKTVYDASEFSRAINGWGSKRNNGNVIAFRDGCTVSLRPEFTSKESLREFSNLVKEYNPTPSHTPGPWTAHGCTLYAGSDRIAQTWDAEYDGLPTPEMEANAKLIAAAPQLLESLQWALAQISDDLDPDHQEALEAALGVLTRFGGSR
jgi:hypothetical protein